MTILAAGCGRVASVPPAVPVAAADPCAVALAPVTGADKLSGKIAAIQQKARAASDPIPALEQLGWLFVAKARSSFDPGYYKLAEQCALCIESKRPNDETALLLRGHVLDSLHRFKQAEVIARQLVASRELAADYGLLGDVLMEQGRLDEATAAYQKMMDLRPDLHAYARAAHMRWLKGDLTGAIEAMQLAARASSPNDPESAAWVFSRLAMYRLQAGDTTQARRDCEAALQFQTDYALALLVRGRILMAEGKVADAVPSLQRAAELNPLPEYHWVLAEALRATGQIGEADAVEAKINARDDPRTVALFLATTVKDAPMALRLASEELPTREDVFTLDALAWALHAAGKDVEAQTTMRRALAEGTQDARLFLHAATILSAGDFAGKAAALRQMLLPSEQKLLAALPDRNPTLAASRSTDSQPTTQE